VISKGREEQVGALVGLFEESDDDNTGHQDELQSEEKNEDDKTMKRTTRARELSPFESPNRDLPSLDSNAFFTSSPSEGTVHRFLCTPQYDALLSP